MMPVQHLIRHGPQLLQAALAGAAALRTSHQATHAEGFNDVAGYSAEGVVGPDALRLRAAPTTQSEILDLLDPGTVLSITGGDGTWHRVVVDGREGYVHGAHVTLSGGAATPAADAGAELLAPPALGPADQNQADHDVQDDGSKGEEAARPGVTGWWSQTAGTRGLTAAEAGVVAELASFADGADAPPSSEEPGLSWQTDCAGGDFDNMISAYQHTQAGNRAGALAAVSGYGKDAAALVDRIEAAYAREGVIPTTHNELLTALGILQQCKEFADRVARSAGGKTGNYGDAVDVGAAGVRPGMLLYQGSAHAMVIEDVHLDAHGNATLLKIVDSNRSGAWSNPGGDVPWARKIRRGERKPAGHTCVAIG